MVLVTAACLTILSAVKVSHKRIFLFTNDDNPNEDNDNFRNQVIVHAIFERQGLHWHLPLTAHTGITKREGFS